MSIEAGWYPDPELNNIDRWWDGAGWTDKRRNTPENVQVSGTVTPQGWYVDPELRGVERWWDGAQWTDKLRNAPGSAG